MTKLHLATQATFHKGWLVGFVQLLVPVQRLKNAFSGRHRPKQNIELLTQRNDRHDHHLHKRREENHRA